MVQQMLPGMGISKGLIHKWAKDKAKRKKKTTKAILLDLLCSLTFWECQEDDWQDLAGALVLSHFLGGVGWAKLRDTQLLALIMETGIVEHAVEESIAWEKASKMFDEYVSDDVLAAILPERQVNP